MAVFFCLINFILLIFTAIITDSIGVIAIGVVGLLLLLLCCRGLNDKIYKSLSICIVVAYVFMAFVYIATSEKYGIPYYGGDDINFEEYGAELYKSNILTFENIPYIQGMFYAKGYLVIIAWMMKISSFFGVYSTMSPRVLNIYLWFSVCALTYKRMLAKCGNQPLCKKLLAILLLFPNALYISSFVYRDAMMCFLLVVFVYNFEKLVDGERKWALRVIRCLICVGAIYILYYTRLQLLYIILLIVVVRLFLGKKRLSKEHAIILVSAACIIGLALFQLSGGLDLISQMNDNYSAMRYGQSDGLSNIVFGTAVIPFGIILRFAYGLICPFPGVILKLDFFSEPLFSMEQLFVSMGTFVQCFSIPYLLKSAKRLDYATLKFGIIYLSIILTTFTFRHFILLYPFLAEAICKEISDANPLTRKKNSALCYIAICGATIVYLALKL